MNFKVIAIIILLSLCFFFGFKTISSYRNETSNQNLGELKILKYLPRDNKLLFISNSQSSDIRNSFATNFNSKNIDGIILIKNSILSYLGIDIGENKLEDLYNNELTISTYNNNKREKDDILIVLKIKPEKNINDLLSLSNPIDQNDEIIKIYRENKLNYLNYIYKTNDDYIIASSNKKLILDSIEASNNWPETKNNFSTEILRNFKKDDEFYYWYRIKKEAQIISKEKNVDESVKFIEAKFNHLDKSNVKFLYDLANYYRSSKRYKEAIPVYTKILDEFDNNDEMKSDLLYRRGSSYERIKNFDKADDDLLNSLKIYPDDAYVLNYLAYSWLEREYKINEAIKMLEIAYEAESDDPYIIDSIGWAYYLINDFSKAEEFLIRAVELMPDDPIVNDHYGDVLWKLDRKIQARYFWSNVLLMNDVEDEIINKINSKLIQGL